MSAKSEEMRDTVVELAELREENERLRMFLDHVSVALAVVGPDCKIIWTNDIPERRFGLPSPISEMHCQELNRHRMEQCRDCPAPKAFSSGQVESGVLDFTIASGESRQYLLTATPICEEKGAVAQVMMLAQDITDYHRTQRDLQKHAEMLEVQSRRVIESTKQKSRFFASMSHELRVPLTSIIGFTEILLEDMDEPLTTNQRNLLSKISRNSERLLAMINDLLDISKIESGRMTVNLSKVHIPTLVTQVVETMMPLVKDKSVELSADTTDQFPLICTDEQKLSQVLVNLVSNAIKFTPAGNVTVKASLAGSRICISVSDTGIGIRRKDFNTIFEEFSRVDGNNRKPGTGLGLAVTRKLVHILGGDIKVSSKLEEGSTFTVTLPTSLTQSLLERRLRTLSR